MNLTEKAKNGELDPVIGRGKETDRIVEILSILLDFFQKTAKFGSDLVLSLDFSPFSGYNSQD